MKSSIVFFDTMENSKRGTKRGFIALIILSLLWFIWHYLLMKKEYDKYRDAFLKNIGITTIRINAEDVVDNTSQVVNEILIAILNKKL